MATTARAGRFRVAGAGEGERGGAARRDGDGGVVRPGGQFRNSRLGRGPVVLARAVDREALAIGGDETDAPGIHAEGSGQLQPVLHRQQSGGARPDVNQPAAAAQRAGHKLGRTGEGRTFLRRAFGGAELPREQGVDQRRLGFAGVS